MKIEYKKAFKYPFHGKGWLKKFFLMGLATVFPLTFPLAFGFFIRAYRNLIHGEEELPELHDIMEIYSHGIMGLLVVVFYLLPSFILILAGYLLTGGGRGFIASTGTISFAGMIFSMLILIGLLLLLFACFILPVVLAYYADTLDFMEVVKFPEIVNRIFGHIDKYFSLLIVYICIAGAVLSIFFFALPFAIFYLHLFYAYLFTPYYVTYQD